MSRIFGIGTNYIVAQPGFTATQSDEGGWTGSHSFAIRTSAWNSEYIRSQFKKGTSITQLDQSLSSYFDFLRVAQVSVISEEGDITIVSTQLSGGKSAQYSTDPDNLNESAQPTYRLNCSLQDAPLSQHPKWATFSDLEKQALSEMISGGLVFDEPSSSVGTRDERSFWVEPNSEGTPYVLTSPAAIVFAKLIASGDTTYLRPAITWTESTQGNQAISSSQLNKIGKISKPRGNEPTPSGGRDWMLTGAFDEERAGLHTTELEWTLSEEGGFNETLYEE